MRKIPGVFLFAGLVLLSACGEKTGEPGAAEMQEAVGANIKADIDRQLARASARAGQALPGFQGFTAFSKKECIELVAPATGYKCSFSMSIRINDVETSRDYEGFFARSENGELTFKP